MKKLIPLFLSFFVSVAYAELPLDKDNQAIINACRDKGGDYLTETEGSCTVVSCFYKDSDSVLRIDGDNSRSQNCSEIDYNRLKNKIKQNRAGKADDRARQESDRIRKEADEAIKKERDRSKAACIASGKSPEVCDEIARRSESFYKDCLDSGRSRQECDADWKSKRDAINNCLDQGKSVQECVYGRRVSYDGSAEGGSSGGSANGSSGPNGGKGGSGNGGVNVSVDGNGNIVGDVDGQRILFTSYVPVESQAECEAVRAQDPGVYCVYGCVSECGKIRRAFAWIKKVLSFGLLRPACETCLNNYAGRDRVLRILRGTTTSSSGSKTKFQGTGVVRVSDVQGGAQGGGNSGSGGGYSGGYSGGNNGGNGNGNGNGNGSGSNGSVTIGGNSSGVAAGAGGGVNVGVSGGANGGSGIRLPAYCDSPKDSDREKCAQWIRENKRLVCSSSSNYSACMGDDAYEDMLRRYSIKDCVNCSAGSRSSQSTLSGVAEIIGAIAPPLAMFGSAYVGAKAYERSNQAWANAAVRGFEQCRLSQQDYQSYLASNQLPALTPDQQANMKCNGYQLGGYAGLGSPGLNGYLGAGYSPGFLGGMIGPYGAGYPGVYGPGGGVGGVIGGFNGGTIGGLYVAGGAGGGFNGGYYAGGINGGFNGGYYAGGINGGFNGGYYAGGINGGFNGGYYAGGINGGNIGGIYVAGGANGGFNGGYYAGGINGGFNGGYYAGGINGGFNGGSVGGLYVAGGVSGGVYGPGGYSNPGWGSGVVNNGIPGYPGYANPQADYYNSQSAANYDRMMQAQGTAYQVGAGGYGAGMGYGQFGAGMSPVNVGFGLNAQIGFGF